LSIQLLHKISKSNSPNKWLIPWRFKKVLGCISKQTALKDGKIISVRDIPLSFHDLYHLEVAKLPRIQIGDDRVSGIHGINTSILHECPIVEEYDGILDEARVAFHEFIVKTSIYNTIKAIAWSVWLVLQGINPIAVIWRHYKSLHDRI
jgi:hypothetical protein